MAVRKIRKIGDPVLREIASKVDKIDSGIKDIVKDMVDTMKEKGGVGLAAPQIGISKRIIIVRNGERIETFINPELEVLDNNVTESGEGCLSIYSIQGFTVDRYRKIRVRAKNLKGKPVDIIAEGFLAIIFQHEIDHLNGKMFIDHLDPDSRMELLERVNELKS
jgi:peptide deformylase